MTKSLLEQLLEQLKQDFSKMPHEAPLPSMLRLAEKHNVSRPTLKRAFQQLSLDGLIKLSQGKRAIIWNPNKIPNTLSILKSQKKLLSNSPKKMSEKPGAGIERELLEQLQNGELKVGDLLPKRLWLASRWQVSERTISSVYQKLFQKGWVYRKGRSWIVGSPLKRYSPPQMLHPPTILVGAQSVNRWVMHTTERKTGDFGKTFLREARRAGVKVQPVYGHSDARSKSYDLSEPSLLSLTQKLGDRYLGALFVTPSRYVEGFERGIGLLGRLPKPIVWFDSSGAIKRHPVFEQAKAIRVFASETKAAKTAVSELFKAGHRKLAYISLTNESWVKTRELQLRKAAEKISPRIEIYPCYRSIKPNMSIRVKVFHELDSLLFDFLKTHRVTALIVSNDKMSHYVCDWLYEQDIHIPNQLSIMSFDDRVDRLPHNLSSVNFGFENLGYLAFHAIFRDIPLFIKKNRDMTGKTFVDDMSTITAPDETFSYQKKLR